MHQDHIKPQAPAGISNLKMGRKTVAISDGLTRFLYRHQTVPSEKYSDLSKSQYRVSYVYIILWNSLKPPDGRVKDYQRQLESYTQWKISQNMEDLKATNRSEISDYRGKKLG